GAVDGGNHLRQGGVARGPLKGDGDVGVQGDRAAPNVVVGVNHQGCVAEGGIAAAVEEEMVVPNLQAALDAAVELRDRGTELEGGAAFDGGGNVGRRGAEAQ